MLPETAPELTTAELLQLIEEARNVELCRDLDSLREILQTVWNIEETPKFDNYDKAIKAELLRLCGVFLSFYGNARSLKDYQIRGKNLLIDAIEIFEENKISDKSAEAKINLAFCYWNLGEVSETEAILDIVEAEFGKNLLHPIYLRICVNRLLIYFWKQDLKSAIKIVEEITIPMQFCTDLRLQAMFHNQAGIFYRATKKYDKAAFHLNESIRFAKKTNNRFFFAIILNNLAYLYKELKDFQKAFDCISESIDEVNKIKHQGFLPHALDTKALIYLDWNKPKNALETIKESIEYFKKGEDYRGLTDALWTKIRCLLRLGRKHDALTDFVELENLASEHIGEIAVKKFAKNLSDEIYVLRNLPLTDEVSEFKKAQVGAAMIEANGAVGKAAKILGLKNHQALSDILNKQFPGLLNELGFQRRAKRNSVVLNRKNSRAKNLNPADTPQYWEIAPLNLQDKQMSFDFEVAFDNFETYYFDKYFMKGFGIERAAIVAVAPVTKLKAGMLIVGADTNQYFVGKAEYDKWTEIYFVLDANGNPFPLDRKSIIGEPVGYCFSSEIDKVNITFSRLEI
jgi:tetratricopeptide (TPR) repeat protein